MSPALRPALAGALGLLFLPQFAQAAGPHGVVARPAFAAPAVARPMPRPSATTVRPPVVQTAAHPRPHVVDTPRPRHRHHGFRGYGFAPFGVVAPIAREQAPAIVERPAADYADVDRVPAYVYREGARSRVASCVPPAVHYVKPPKGSRPLPRVIYGSEPPCGARPAPTPAAY